MYLTIDKGNTRMKWALFEGDQLVRLSEEGEGLPDEEVDAAIVCATGQLDMDQLQLKTDNMMVLSSQSRLPITLDYATPETLGPDRIAAACGAHKLCAGKGCVIVDAGTCITIDYIDSDGVFRGGAILPGIEIMFRALHTFTAKLPLLTIEDPTKTPITGRTTQESMEAGVLTATRYAVEGFVAHYREKQPDTPVLLTGGDADWVWGEGLLNVKGCVWEPYLVMIGLNEILKENEKK